MAFLLSGPEKALSIYTYFEEESGLFLKNFQKTFNGSVFWDKICASRDSGDVNENRKTIIKNNNVGVYKSIQK